MSNMFRDLGAQGASSSRQNTEKWLEVIDTPEAKALFEKEKNNPDSLTQAERNTLEMYKHFEQKGKAEGIENPKKVSASTGIPDFTDQAVRARKMSQAMQLASGRGRKQSFLGGQYDSDNLGAGSMLGAA